MRLAQGDRSHQTELTPATQRPPGEARPVSRMAEELALAIGCPVEVSYLKDTRQVLVVAHLKPGQTVRVTLPAPPVGMIEHPFAALKYDLLKALRYEMNRNPTADDPPIY
jgi:hypothetical protein